MDGLPFAQVAYGAVLGVVHSQCSGHSAKALVGAVVRAALSLEMGIPEQDAANSINAMEQLLADIKPLIGKSCAQRANVSEVKTLLRGKGADGTKLASRVGKLSKMRNTNAHPDVGLIEDIRALLANGAQEEDHTPASGDSSGYDSI